MPKIKITEKDITGQEQNNGVSHTVYIPGKALTGKAVGPTLCSSIKELNTLAGWDGEATSGTVLDITHLSFKLARHLINLGMKVLYEGIETDASGLPVTKTFDELKDKGLYDIRFITTGGYGQLLPHLLEVAQDRGDCTYLMDHAETITVTEGTYASNVRSLFETMLTGMTEPKPEFAAGFTPWFKSKNEDLGGSSSSEVSVPASFGYLFAYAKSIKANNGEWLAIAGSSRGIISELTSILHEYTSAEVEILQARATTAEVELDAATDNVGMAINPIAYVRPFGHILWGNRTLKNNPSTKKTTATSFLNVRNLVSTIKKKLYDAARKYTFEQNGDVLWSNFQNEIIPTLDEMQTGNGILGYRFEKLPTTAKARITARLTIIPVEAVEDFELEVLLADSLDVTE